MIDSTGLRFWGTLLSSAVYDVLEQPSEFVAKVARFCDDDRFGQRFNSVSFFLSKTRSKLGGQPDPRILGEYDQLIEDYARVSVWGKIRRFGRYRFAVRNLEKLSRTAITSLPIKQLAHNGIRVLMLTNNCSPYTTSGYTVRTDALTGAMSAWPIEIVQVTRYGYPAVIGRKFSKSQSDAVNIVPFWLPYRERKRAEAYIRTLTDIAVENDVNVIHATTDFNNGYIASRVARNVNVPWTYEVRGEPHNTWLSKVDEQHRLRAANSIYYRRAEQAEIESAKAASKVFVLSELSRQKLVSAGVNTDKISVIPNAIESRYFDGARLDKQDVRRKFELGDGYLVGAITSLVSYEGLEFLIRAVEYLPSSVKVVIVGDGEEATNLQQLNEELGTSNAVEFVGRRPHSEMPSWYSALDAFVVPRIDHEVCRNVTPIKPLAALALGVPVVASDLPALREVTGGHAKYVPSGDPEAIAEGIMEVLESPDLYKAPKWWISERTWCRNAKIMFDEYSQLFEEGEPTCRKS